MWKIVAFVVVSLIIILLMVNGKCHHRNSIKKDYVHTKVFGYDLGYTVLPSVNSNARTIVCLHGMTGNSQIVNFVKKCSGIDATFIGFNFPDHSIRNGEYDPQKSTFGSINELLPVIYVLKKLIIEQGLQSVDVYGFSAGGGALINTLAVLNTTKHDAALEQVGITQQDKNKILSVLQQGYILLDAPLKSIEEIIDLRGNNYELKIIASHYVQNGMRPIDSLKHLQGLSLYMIVCFAVPDEILFNRDDVLFVERLKKYNALGTVNAVYDTRGGGHNSCHKILWETYRAFIGK